MMVFSGNLSAQRIMPKLSRGMIALNKGSGQVYLSWRLMGNDPADVSFNLYKTTSGVTTKIAGPITATTDYTVSGISTAVANTFFVRAIINGVEQPAGKSYTLPANAPVRQYIAIPLTPEPETDGVNYYTLQTHVGDVDGDGEYEFLNLRLYTGSVAPTSRSWKIDCQRLDGTLLWRLDLGPNFITNDDAGTMIVEDFDGDGKAEVMLRTFEGTCFNYGSADSIRIGDTNHNGTTIGQNVEPEFLSVVNGLTGKEMDRVPYEPSNGGNGWTKFGDNHNPNYVFFASAYLDGVLPSFISVRGIGQGGLNTYAYAFDYRNGKITQRWNWAPKVGDNVSQGHNIMTFDIDNDGKDEIEFMGSALDDDGKLLYSNQDFWHGDHYRVCDMDPDRPGYEIFSITQASTSDVGMSIIDGMTGKYLRKWYMSDWGDVSRGDAGDYYAGSKGVECHSTMASLTDVNGNVVADNRFPTWGIWWDGDLQRELINGVNGAGTNPAIDKWSTGRLFAVYNDGGAYSNSIPYGGHPQFWGDIMGDWREEMITQSNDNLSLRLYSTWEPAQNRIYTLMDNPGYKSQASCRGRVGGKFPDYYLGGGMEPPPPPACIIAKLHWAGSTSANTWDTNTTSSWLNNKTVSTFATNDSVLFDLTGVNSVPVIITGNVSPAQVTVYNPNDYTFNGKGAIVGTTGLTKVGRGTLTVNAKTGFTGKTIVWDGALNVNDSLIKSPVIVHGGTWGGKLSEGKTGGRLGGSGVYGKVTLEYGGALVPGQGVGYADTITIDSLIEKIGSVNFVDLSSDPSGITYHNDLVVVNKSFNFADGITIGVNLTNGTVTPGFYPIFKCQGTIIGNVSKISVVGLNDYVYSVANVNGVIGISIPSQRTKAANVVWSGSGSAWDLGVSANWLRNGTSDVFVGRDSVTFNDTGAANKTINLSSDVNVGNMLFDGITNYTITGSGSLCGTGSLIKRGSSTVTLSGKTNKFTGSTTIEAGTLEVGSLNNTDEVSSLGIPTNSTNSLIINGGSTLSLISTTCSSNRPIKIQNGQCAISTTSGNTLVVQAPILGNGTLVKAGTGQLRINSANTFTGGVVLNSGDLNMYGSFASGTIVTLNAGNLYGNGTNDFNVNVPAGATGTVYAPGRSDFSGSLTGAGTLNLSTTYIRDMFSGDWSAFEGTINLFGGGQCRLYNSKGYAKATFNLSATGNSLFYDIAASSDNGTQTVALGGLKGVANTYLYSEDWVIGSNNSDCQFNGKIVSNSLTKVGTGNLILTDTCFYTAATNINAGKITLGVSKAYIKGSVYVSSGGTLAGVGVVNGASVIKSGGTVMPGYNGIGKLTFNSVVSYLSGAITEIEYRKTSNVVSNDMIASANRITINGTLNLTNIGTTVLAAGDSLQIFKGASYSGSFTTINPATPGDGLSWDVSALNKRGVLRVALASSIKSLSDLGISISPNPVVDHLTVSLPTEEPNTRIEIYSINGLKVYSQIADKLKASISLGGLQAGTYLVKVITPSKVAIGKIIKQ